MFMTTPKLNVVARLLGVMLAAQQAYAGVTYSYDSAGRLVKADYGSGGSVRSGWIAAS